MAYLSRKIDISLKFISELTHKNRGLNKNYKKGIDISNKI